MKKAILHGVLVYAVFSLLTSCKDNSATEQANPLDIQLEDALKKSSNGTGKSYYLLPESTEFSKIPQDPKNVLTSAKVELGKLLFHETGLARRPIVESSKETYSCASCHHVKAGFQACVPQGMGEGGIGFGLNGEKRIKNTSYSDASIDVQPVRSPSALNIAYQTNILWNGQFGATHLNENTQASWTVGTPKEKNKLGFQGTETQAIAGQDVHRLGIDRLFITNIPTYKNLYVKAFDETSLQNPTQLQINGGLAIAAYERTLLANQAPFQDWLKGNYSSMTDVQKKGAILFFGKAGCVTCHNGPSLANMEFYALGMGDLKNGKYGENDVVGVTAAKAEHKGRGGFTGKPEDMYKFKVPQLYNLKDSPFYGHGASIYSLEDVIKYKNEAKPQNSVVPTSQLAKEFKALNLTSDEMVQLTEFIKNGLYDRNLQRYVPKSIPSGLAFPNNDTQSRKDLGFIK